jgi:predicted RNase H-like HicB family nuclease
MRYYFAVVHKDEDSAYGVHFPDVSGCFSAADDVEDLVSNASEALSLYAEDVELSPPRSIDELHRDPDVAADLATGAFSIAVPLIENDAHVVRANITMESGMLKAIDAEAKARGLTHSAFLAQAARRAIEQR